MYSHRPDLLETASPDAARQLQDALRRILRARPEPAEGPPEGAAMLVLHLSRLRPPAPRPHHRRIAQAILMAAAQRHGGQIFAMANADLVLLCPPPDPRNFAETFATRPLAQALEKLFRVDVADPSRLLSIWPLAGQAAAALAYVRAAPAAAPASAPAPAPASTAPTRPPHAAPGLLAQQTAIRLGVPGAGRRLVPLYRRFTFSAPILRSLFAAEAGPGPGSARPPAAASVLHDMTDDPLVLRHLAGQQHDLLHDLLPGLPPGAPGAALAVCLPLSLPMLAGARFQDWLARAAQIPGWLRHRFGVVLDIVEACAEPAAYQAAQARLAALGATTVLGGIGLATLSVLRPAALPADLFQLDWSPALGMAPDAAGADPWLAEALDDLGRDRILLCGADTEAALEWGRAQRLLGFAGRHVEAMLAASRMAACAEAPGCTLGQCQQRGQATTQAGQAQCRNRALLARALPEPPILGQPNSRQPNPGPPDPAFVTLRHARL